MSPPGLTTNEREGFSSPGGPPDARVDELRGRIYESALRLGLLVRAYVSRPDQRIHVRHELAEMLAAARGISDEVAGLSHGRPRPEVMTAGEEADRLVSMVTSLRKVIAHLEHLERRGAAEPTAARDRKAKAAMKEEIDRLVAKLTEEELQIADLESELDAVRRLRVRDAGRDDETRRLRRRAAAAEDRAKSGERKAKRLRLRLAQTEEEVLRLKRSLRLARRGSRGLGRPRRKPRATPRRRKVGSRRRGK